MPFVQAGAVNAHIWIQLFNVILLALLLGPRGQCSFLFLFLLVLFALLGSALQLALGDLLAGHRISV